MALVSINLSTELCHALLALLERGVAAVERLAGPIPEYRPPTQATLRDYAVVGPDELADIRQAEEEFAIRNMVVPGSPAYIKRVEEFEEQVRQAYGEEAVERLPWKVRTGAEHIADIGESDGRTDATQSD